jgi:hypothetical protein
VAHALFSVDTEKFRPNSVSSLVAHAHLLRSRFILRLSSKF